MLASKDPKRCTGTSPIEYPATSRTSSALGVKRRLRKVLKWPSKARCKRVKEKSLPNPAPLCSTPTSTRRFAVIPKGWYGPPHSRPASTERSRPSSIAGLGRGLQFRFNRLKAVVSRREECASWLKPIAKPT